MTTPGNSTVGLPPASPVAYQPWTATDANYGASGLVGQSAIARSDGKVLYAWSETNIAAGSAISGFRLCYGTATDPTTFVYNSNTVTYSNYIVRWYNGGAALNGTAPHPTLSRHPTTGKHYMTFTFRLQSGGGAPSPGLDWQHTGLVPSTYGFPSYNDWLGTFLLESTDDGDSWNLKTMIQSNAPTYTLDGHHGTTELLFVDDDTWVIYAVSRYFGFGDPQGVWYLRSTDHGATWSVIDSRTHGFLNHVDSVSRTIAPGPDKNYSAYLSTDSSPGATNHWLTWGAQDGTGLQTLHDSTTNTAGHFWDNTEGRLPFCVGGKYRMYLPNTISGKYEVWETDVSAPVYTDFTKVWDATVTSDAAMIAQEHYNDIIQPIGNNLGAWLTRTRVIGLPWPTSTCACPDVIRIPYKRWAMDIEGLQYQWRINNYRIERWASATAGRDIPALHLPYKDVFTPYYEFLNWMAVERWMRRALCQARLQESTLRIPFARWAFDAEPSWSKAEFNYLWLERYIDHLRAACA